MKKGEIYETVIDEVRFPDLGYGTVDGETVVIKNTVPGQKVRFMITKKRNGNYRGMLLSVLERSVLETREPLCSNHPDCGGCTFQTMGYEHQKKMKAGSVLRILAPVFEKAGISRSRLENELFEGITDAGREYPYRNKMEYSFGDRTKGGELTLGLHRKNSNFDILPCTDCALVHEDFNRIVNCVQEYCRDHHLDYYHRRTHEGFLRNLLVRRGEKTGEILIAVVTSSQSDHSFDDLAEQLLELNLQGRITGILHMICDSLSDAVKSEETRVLYGRDHIYDELLGLRYRIGPFSFFQTNTLGAEVLYGIVREYIGDIKDAVVFDLYSGTGTIAQILSASAAKVTGIEIVEEAVLAARENAKTNDIGNCEFLCGDVFKVLNEIEEHPDFIILDPPRDGIHPKAIGNIIDYGAERIVYVSCKPTSLARDLEIFLENGYEVRKIKCVDMFPETVHVETVCLLTHKG
ncbi:MAG: 23S rRNA (uracil(1939)-C(5))-methyltransferase RlmD [Lachnospiraceae bacterium]|nr:23S rRNA (uracil(1939)-C(5))-methyltransferase RlmD [Lachnospiraceae bacterium]